MGTPTTIQQLAVIMIAVLPGLIFQLVQERSRGRTSRDDNLAERVLRAIIAGVLLDAFYLLVLGPWLTRLAGGGKLSMMEAVSARPRQVAVVAVLLLVVVPAAAGWVFVFIQQRRGQVTTRYRSSGTAWEHVFAGLEPCFIRIRLDDGTWVGGWYGSASFASSHPDEGEIYLQSSWHLDRAGQFTERVDGTGGILVRGDAVTLLEIVRWEVPQP